MIVVSYASILTPEVGASLSFALNSVAPALAWLLSRRLQRLRWLPHAMACLWELISFPIFAILIFPRLPSDTPPGPGDGVAEGVLLIPAILAAAVVLLAYCIILLGKVLGILFFPGVKPQ